MKKVMIGILILIPIIILLIIAIVSSFLSLQAWVAVEDLTIKYKDSGSSVRNLGFELKDIAGVEHSFLDFVDVVVMPEKANRYTIEWKIKNIVCTDEEYKQSYDDYVNASDKTGLTPVPPAAMLIDDNGNEAAINTSGKFVINAYCYFNIEVHAETVSKNFGVTVQGFTVEDVQITDLDAQSESTLIVGESKRLSARFTPLDSIVEKLEYSSDNEAVAKVDANGVVTALSKGTAHITATAAKYRQDGVVKSNTYTLNVADGASRLFGNSVTVHTNEVTFEALGIDKDNIDEAGCVGCEILEDRVKITAGSAKIALKEGGALAVSVCEEDDIVIQNYELYNYAKDGDFVLAISPIKLRLKAVFRSDLIDDEPTGVIWESDDGTVATVDENGEVTGLSRGLAVITAKLGDKQCSTIINVQTKVASLQLLTSDSSLEVGLAQQTVFASDVFAGEGAADPLEVIGNSTLIRIHGEPENATEEDLAYFYSSYKFEVDKAYAEYAVFDADMPNRLRFIGEKLEGKGVVPIKIKVSARYPRYEGVQTHTVAYVTINAVYGVQVSTFDEFQAASKLQWEYANKEGNLIAPKETESIVAPNNSTYYVAYAPRSKTRYAITLVSDIAIPLEYKVNWDNNSSGYNFQVYGDLYGNDHMLSATDSQMYAWNSYLVCASWSDVTISNVRARACANRDTVDMDSFAHGYVLESAYYYDNTQKLVNVRVEYSILENAYGGFSVSNSEIAMDGVIVRNIARAAMYVYARVIGDRLFFSHLKVNNCVFTSVVGTSISLSYEDYAVLDNDYGRFTANTSNESVSRAESYQWVEENLVPRGWVSSLEQTGFLDLYAWQNARDASLIMTGNDKFDELLRTLTGPMFSGHPDFAPGRYIYKEEPYIHMGFITSGNSFPNMEKSFAQISIEDDRFYCIYSKEMTIPDNNLKSLSTMLRNGLDIKMYCYKNTANITPASVFTLNQQAIEHLHGRL